MSSLGLSRNLFSVFGFQGTNPDRDSSVIKDKKHFLPLIADEAFASWNRKFKLTYILNLDNFQNIRQPPALPYRLQHSTIGRLSLNHRVRDGNGCVPQAHRHRKCLFFPITMRFCIATGSLLPFFRSCCAFAL